MNQESSVNAAGGLLVLTIPFLAGVAYRLDLALVFSLVAFFYFLMVPLILQPLREFVGPRWLQVCALVVCGGIGGMFDTLLAWLAPALWQQLHVFVPLLGASPLLLQPLLEQDARNMDLLGVSMRRWGIVSALLVAAALVRELVATGALSLFLAPGVDAALRLVPAGWFSLPVLLMAPAVFVLAGLGSMFLQRRSGPSGQPAEGEARS